MRLCFNQCSFGSRVWPQMKLSWLIATIQRNKALLLNFCVMGSEYRHRYCWLSNPVWMHQFFYWSLSFPPLQKLDCPSHPQTMRCSLWSAVILLWYSCYFSLPVTLNRLPLPIHWQLWPSLNLKYDSASLISTAVLSSYHHILSNLPQAIVN